MKTQRVNEIGAKQLKGLIEEHVEATGSKRAQHILDNWDEYLPKFTQVYPSSEAEAPEVSGVAAKVAEPVAA